MPYTADTYNMRDSGREDGMNKAVFLDRDGTINVEKNYLYKKEDFEFLPGVIEAMKKLQDEGFLLFIITNQSGIGRGYYTEEDFNKLNTWMLNELEKNAVNITKVYYCPHLPDASVIKYRVVCNCRKPALGMYRQAIEDYKIDIDNSYAIGDKIRDCSICEKTGCRGYLISDAEKPGIIKAVKEKQYKNIEYAADLFSAVNKILEESKCIS